MLMLKNNFYSREMVKRFKDGFKSLKIQTPQILALK